MKPNKPNEDGSVLTAEFLFSGNQFLVEIVPESGVYWVELWSQDTFGNPAQCIYANGYDEYYEAFSEMQRILDDPAAYV